MFEALRLFIGVKAANLPIGLPATPGGLPSGVGVGASGTIYFWSDVENAIYKVVKK